MGEQFSGSDTFLLISISAFFRKTNSCSSSLRLAVDPISELVGRRISRDSVGAEVEGGRGRAGDKIGMELG